MTCYGETMFKKAEIIDLLIAEIESANDGQLKKSQIKPSDELLNDLGLDSLSYAEVYVAVEEKVGTAVDESGLNWSNVRTIEQLAEVIYNSQPCSI